MAYTTRAKVEAFMNADLSSVDSSVTAWIASVKAFIDRYTGRTFEAASETRYYDGNNKDRIIIDPFVGSATVQLLNYDGSVWLTLTEGADGDFVTYPLNETQKWELVLMPNASVGIFARAFENLIDEGDEDGADTKRLIKVTASFGASSSVPADIELAATQLVAAIAERRVSGGVGAKKAESLGDYSVTFADVGIMAEELSVTSILDGWREPTL